MRKMNIARNPKNKAVIVRYGTASYNQAIRNIVLNFSLKRGNTRLLFSGPSGAGKTKAAEIIAKKLNLDLHKIDLSCVVSKYIGETEKNLSKIFKEAETSNAVLFFDEADALFGKRPEVRDSHDRYANIEINYLLQKMEEHEGVVILSLIGDDEPHYIINRETGEIKFGDGERGRIPPSGSKICASYRTGGEKKGEVVVIKPIDLIVQFRYPKDGQKRIDPSTESK